MHPVPRLTVSLLLACTLLPFTVAMPSATALDIYVGPIGNDRNPGTKAKPLVLGYEVWTPVQKLVEIVDISPCMATKLRAIRAYRSQCAVLDFDAAILGLNRYRGEMHSWPGGRYAEVFTAVRV